MAFEKFRKEISLHSAKGYHKAYGRIDRSQITTHFAVHHWSPPKEYADFLATIGPGRYFAGALVFFPLDRGTENVHSVLEVTNQLEDVGSKTSLGIGYDGTTEGCYCVSKRNQGDKAVYWYSWNDGVTTTVNESFVRFVESAPTELYSEKIYAGFRTPGDTKKIREVIAQRQAFEVRVVSFDMQLTCKPDKPDAFLPRYNRVVLSVTKEAPSNLAKLTIKVLRRGSKIGTDNVEYVTIDVSRLPVGVATAVEAYVFDPFNLPFDKIESAYDPEIDLSDPRRVRFKEIEDYL